ncbi:MAG: hypothetical protein H0Z19_04245 [Archaeoglobus sp.]|uniref:hypothetical protein n=1 Tax=Archaeoglobus sp. TaxID=1872626 RepID=UPI001D9AC94F|nr:hypothetical protein [Archaeoglobus sp.]MBO8179678.1 hypothetical protein [Archaeoglobus sp.]
MRWILLFLAILLASMVSLCTQPEEKPGIEQKNQSSIVYNVTLDSSYFEKFKEIIDGDSSPKEKETAILEMAQIAIMLNDSDRVVEYLKDVATTSDDQNVVAAAYAALDIIRDYYPPEALGELAVDVDGELKLGSSVNITANVRAYSNCNGMVGIKRLPIGFELKSNVRYKFEISADEAKSFTFEIVLPEQSGEYPLTVTLFLEKSRFDYQQIDQKIILKVNEEGGEVLY